MPTLLELADDVKFLFTGIVYEPIDLVSLTRTGEIDAHFFIMGNRNSGVVARRYESACRLGIFQRQGHWQHAEPYDQSSNYSCDAVIHCQWEAHAFISSYLKQRGCVVWHHTDERTRRVLDVYHLRLELL